MIDRRKFLWRCGGGLGGVALADLLTRERGASRHDGDRHHVDRHDVDRHDVDRHHGGRHHAPRARRVVQLFMSGAASQVDTFDHKPELIRRDGQKFDPGGRVELFQSDPGPCMRSPWKWRQHGESGKWVSGLLPQLARCVDDIAFVHSMVSTSNVHGPATFLQTTGFVQPGFPSSGAWCSYGLGAATDDLPAFVVLPDARGFAPGGPANWQAGFLPAEHQGTMIRPDREHPIADLRPPGATRWIDDDSERASRALLARLNRAHAAARPGDSRLDARIESYELAARLQLSAPELLDLSDEPAWVRQLYGLDDAVTEDFGRRCLLARRLCERGVRFVQVWSGADNGFPRRNWDSHEDLARDHGTMGRSMDRPAAALLVDLKQRGLLDDTIVMWTTEFGRMPCSQGQKGRDHNPFAFTCWLAGGGIRGGVSYGESDEWSYRAVDRPTTAHDVHATVLRLLGIDHERLVFRIDGLDRRLTDQEGRVIDEILT